jgi:hypothetical protein
VVVEEASALPVENAGGVAGVALVDDGEVGAAGEPPLPLPVRFSIWPLASAGRRTHTLIL